MRLTLRTLLAYLDGNLEPDDAEDIGKKIEESEFATKLVHLIRDCTRRLRLGSPPLMGRGLGADPNTVAEYLEYRLGDDRVPEFERICLESEAHLAEVACCHQILTLVLGEPAESDPQMRQRLYALAAQANAPPVQTGAAEPLIATPAPVPLGAAAGSAAGPPPVVRRPRPEVPDYLRESRFRWWPVAALVLVAATLTFAGLFFFGPAPFRERMTALVGTPAEPPAAEPDDEADSSEAPPDADAPAEAPDGADDVQPAEAEAGDAEAARPLEPSTDNSAEPAADAPPRDTLPEGDEAPADAPPAEMPADAKPAVVPPAEAAAGTATPVPPEPKPLDAPAGAPADDTTPPPEPLPADAPPGDSAEMPAEPMSLAPEAAPAQPGAREPAEGFGRYTTTKREVLLKFDPATGDWARLPFASPLNKGDRLMSLPLFRPTITLSSNITIQADGPAQFELVGWNDDGLPIIDLQYGRLLMLTVGRAGNALQLEIDGASSLVTFVDPESTLALEVRRQLPPGKDPTAGPAPLTANLYATSGLLRVQRTDGAPTELQAPAALSLAQGADQPPLTAEFPAWVTREQQSDLDRRAAGDVDGYLTPEKSAGLQLRELSDPQHPLGRRREVRTLAIRSLAHLGDFEPSIVGLNDPDLRHVWEQLFSELQNAIARNPDTAGRVHATLVKQRGAADGDVLFRMLWGYNTTDLQTGSDRELVERLNRNDALDMRVVSFLTLSKLDGGATRGYHPEETEFQRRVPFNAWKGRIGKLVPKGGGAATRPGGSGGGG